MERIRSGSVVTGLIVAFLCGLLIGYLCEKLDMQKEAVKHGAAFYNRETGEWMWFDAESR